jgi:beta-lactamase superfamily II metal-dependent hydrolase
MTRRYVAPLLVFLSMLTAVSCGDLEDEEFTEVATTQDATTSATSFPQDRLDACKKLNVSPCMYSFDEVRMLLSPGGAAYAKLQATGTKYNLGLLNLQTTILDSTDPYNKFDVLYYHHKSPLPGATFPFVWIVHRQGSAVEIRDFWYLIAQVLVEMAGGPVPQGSTDPQFQGCGQASRYREKPNAGRVHLDENPTYTDPNLDAQCRYIFTQAMRLTVGLLRGEAKAAALTFGEVGSAFRALDQGSVTTGRRLQVVAAVFLGGAALAGLVALYTGFTSLPDVDAGSRSSRGFVTEAGTLGDVEQDSACGASSLADVQGCPQPRPLGCVTYSTSGGLNETTEDCDGSRRALCYHDKKYEATSNTTEEWYADGACKSQFGIQAKPYLGEALTAAEKNSLRTRYPKVTLATGLVTCMDGSGTQQGCTVNVTVLANTGNGFVVTASGKRQRTQVGIGRKSAKGANDEYGQISFSRSNLDNAIAAAKEKFGSSGAYRAQSLVVHTVNIGSGSCHLLQCYTRKAEESTYRVESLVVDCGSSNTGFSGMGVGAVEAYFRRNSVTAQPAEVQVSRPIVYVSHPDADHYNYLEGAFAHADNAYRPKQIFLGGNPQTYRGNGGDRAGFANFLNDANQAAPGGINVNGGGPLTAQTAALTQNSSISEFQCAGVNLQILAVNEAPPEALRNNQAAIRNGNSLVLGLKWNDGKFAALFPGDALGTTETAALRSAWFNGIPADFRRFLAASHHGSNANGSNSQALINDFAPTVVQYSAGQQYGHPSSTVAGRYENSLGSSSSASHGLVASDGQYRIYATKKSQFGTAYEGSRIQASTVVYRNNLVVTRTPGAWSSGTVVKSNFDSASRPSVAWTNGNLGDVCTLTRAPAGELECN